MRAHKLLFFFFLNMYTTFNYYYLFITFYNIHVYTTLYHTIILQLIMDFFIFVCIYHVSVFFSFFIVNSLCTKHCNYHKGIGKKE